MRGVVVGHVLEKKRHAPIVGYLSRLAGGEIDAVERVGRGIVTVGLVQVDVVETFGISSGAGNPGGVVGPYRLDIFGVVGCKFANAIVALVVIVVPQPAIDFTAFGLGIRRQGKE